MEIANKRVIRFWLAHWSVEFFRSALHCFLGIGPTCRFTPTCSQNMKLSIIKFGFLKGIWLGVSQILNCHPLKER